VYQSSSQRLSWAIRNEHGSYGAERESTLISFPFSMMYLPAQTGV
jgi:hypothetical protein